MALSYEIKPIENINNTKYAICLQCDANYYKYLYVCLKSIHKYAVPEHIYDIVIIANGVSETDKEEVINTFTCPFFIIRFVTADLILDQFEDFFCASRRMVAETYLRLFIPLLFKKYEAVLHLDCDIIVNSDIYDLLSISLGSNLLGACPELLENKRYSATRIKYNTDVLHVESSKYFCSGVILFNISKCVNARFTERCLNLLEELKDPLFHDQDILNSIAQNNYLELPYDWHVMWWPLKWADFESFSLLYPSERAKYLEAVSAPKLIHYGSGYKPWFCPNSALASYWWKFARETPFYETFLYDLIMKISKQNTKETYDLIMQISKKNAKETYDLIIQTSNQNAKQTNVLSDNLIIVLNSRRIVRKYYTYKVLSWITIGNARCRYIKKKAIWHDQLRKLRYLKKQLRFQC